MRIHQCHFCSSKIYPLHGILFVRNDAKEFRFCRSKCHKAFKHRKNPRKVKWTKAFRRNQGKELTIDSTLQFATKRNIPVRYNRDLFEQTINAMNRIQEIKNKREKVFYKNRMRGNHKNELDADIKLVQNNPTLLKMRDVEIQRQNEKALAREERQRKMEVDEAISDIEIGEETESEKETHKIRLKRNNYVHN